MRGLANRRWRWTLVSACALVIPTSALVLADEPGEPIRLEYHAGAGCPDEAAFSSLVRARTSRARPAWQGEHARAFAVNVVAGPPASGSVSVRDADNHAEGTRRVQAGSCAEAADALALVVALAIDPRALAAPATVAAVDAAAPVTVSEAGADAGAHAGDDDGGGDAGPDGDAATTPPPDAGATPISSEPAPQAPPRTPLGLFAGADFTASSGVSPSALLGVSPFLGWRFLRLGFLRAGTGAVDVPGGTAQFTWTVGRLDACPFSLHLGPVIGSACARVESGVLEAAGVSVASPVERKRAWLAAGPLVRAQWTFLGPLFLDADLAAMLRVTDDLFYFRQSTTVDTVPFVGLTGEAGLGVSFL